MEVQTDASGVRNILVNFYIRFFQLLYNARLTPTEFIFINTCGRSGSTLLTNILCDNPEIRGFGETHITYNSTKSIPELIARVYHKNKHFRMTERYVLDKITQNQYSPKAEVIQHHLVKFIYLLRDPRATMRSLINSPFYAGSEERSLSYYRRRLSRLKQDAKSLSRDQNSLIIHFEELTQNAEQTLATITKFFELKKPLTPNYQRPAKRTGDRSEYIKTGSIQSKPRSYAVEVSEKTLHEAQRLYDDYRKELERCCVTADESDLAIR